MSIKTRSIKFNYIMNSIRIFFRMLFPLISFPYVSRILGPENIGIVSFHNSFISYFLLISLLGIPIYGTREVASVRDNEKKLKEITSEILTLNIILSLISLILLYVISIQLMKPSLQLEYIFILSLVIPLTSIGMDWFYQGIEAYTYITIRQILFQILSLAFMFIFIHDQDDVFRYAILIIFASIGSNTLNFIRLLKIIKLKIIINKTLIRHLKPVLVIAGLSFATISAMNIDTFMLGLLSGPISVGYYTAAIKMPRLIITLMAALSSTLVPRLSYNLSGKNDQNRQLVQMGVLFSSLISLVSFSLVYILSKEIIILISGKAFISAANSLKYFSPLIFIITLNTVIGTQIFVPHKKEKISAIFLVIGLILNVILNYLFIPSFNEVGAIGATITSESVIFILLLVFTKKYFKTIIFLRSILKQLFSCISSLVIIKMIIFYTGLSIIGGAIIFLLLSFLFLFILKEKITIDIIHYLKGITCGKLLK